jgi:hypothetical protein
MMVLKEVTKWEGTVPNHTYLLDGSKMVAYIREGTTEPFYFTKPIEFSKRKREFIVLKKNPFKTKMKSITIQVKGSKGAVYEVDPEAKTCTCPGFTYRGNCKHLSNS